MIFWKYKSGHLHTALEYYDFEFLLVFSACKIA